jgi:rare lipoprotein A
MKTKSIFTLLILSLVMLFLSVGCQTIPQTQKVDEPNLVQMITNYSEPDGAAGIARYYKKRYNGRRTTSGEIYNSKKLTAAHPALPMGTLVEVENLSNNKSVIVKINDRCRDHEEVFIDLSRQAARQLGMIKQGTAKVRITIVEENNPSDENTSGMQTELPYISPTYIHEENSDHL